MTPIKIPAQNATHTTSVPLRQWNQQMNFDPLSYGPQVAAILALDANGQRLMPLAAGRCSSQEALTQLQTTKSLFPNSRFPEAALSGLYLYFSCLDESHNLSQSIETPEGAYWHGIMHRQEPDPANAAYWFRQVTTHPIFPALSEAAHTIGLTEGPWDPIGFVDICERARRDPGSPLERMTLETQRAEWQLLFDYCAAGNQHPTSNIQHPLRSAPL
jgi:hypothetical protein